MVGGKCNGMECVVCPLGGGKTCGNKEGMEGLGIVISQSSELSGDLACGKFDGMERVVCPLGGGNEEGMEGFGIVVS